MATVTLIDSTGEVYGVAVYGTSVYGIINSRTIIHDGVQATGSLGSVNITGGVVSGITDLAIADGGTGASSASSA